MRPQFSLSFENGFSGQRIFDLRHGTTTTVGSSTECDITVHDRYISRCHIELRTTVHGVEARDRGSKNGTTLNGRRLTTFFQKLKPEDRVSLAQGKAVFQLVSGRETMPLPADSNGSAYYERQTVLKFERPGRTVLINNRRSAHTLSAIQFNLLECLWERRVEQIAVPRQTLLSRGWGDGRGMQNQDGALRSQVSRIRGWLALNNLHHFEVVSLHGDGYQLKISSPSNAANGELQAVPSTSLPGVGQLANRNGGKNSQESRGRKTPAPVL